MDMSKTSFNCTRRSTRIQSKHLSTDEKNISPNDSNLSIDVVSSDEASLLKDFQRSNDGRESGQTRQDDTDSDFNVNVHDPDLANKGFEVLSRRPIKKKFTVNQPIILEKQKNKNTFDIGDICKSHICYICVALILAILCLYGTQYIGANENFSLDGIKTKFIKQEQVLWKAIEIGVNDTKQFHRPTSFILLYEMKGKNTIKDLLNDISKYLTSSLEKSNNPIHLQSKKLNEPQFIKDYGVVISTYKDELENSGVMIVENLDKVSGLVAQAFHSFCDDIAPLVKKSVFIFTLQVDTFEQNKGLELRKVEKILRTQWSDIKDDIFQPLFTRISSMLLKVNPE